MPESEERREAAIERIAKAIYDDDQSHLSPQRRVPWERAGEDEKNAYRSNAAAAYDAARGGDESERLAAIEACDSVRELAAKFANVSDKQAGEWLDRHLKTIRTALDRAALGGEAEASEQWLMTRVRSVLEGNRIGLRRITEQGNVVAVIGTNDAEKLAREIVAALSQHPEPQRSNDRNVLSSACCNAPLRVDSADEGTSCYVCEKCGKPCDPVQHPETV